MAAVTADDRDEEDGKLSEVREEQYVSGREHGGTVRDTQNLSPLQVNTLLLQNTLFTLKGEP